MRWSWDERLRRYRNLDTGRIIAYEEVKSIVNGIVDRSDDQIRTLTDMLSQGQLNVRDWQTTMAALIKDSYIAQAELAAGGRESMNQRLWGSIGGRLSYQYSKLNAFAEEIAAGNLTSGQIFRRCQMYVNSSRQAFWAVRKYFEQQKGATMERWITKGDDQVCGPCRDAGEMGLQPIGTFGEPGSGIVLSGTKGNATVCVGLTNCRCEKEYA
jgi:hypothetical protein